MALSIRPADDNDRAAINGIFQHFVTTSMAAYPETMYVEGVYDSLKRAGRSLPFLVTETESGEVVAYAQARPYHRADTLKRTAELNGRRETSGSLGLAARGEPTLRQPCRTCHLSTAPQAGADGSPCM